MARKALKRRATTDEATNLLSDYAAAASSPTILLESHELRAIDPNRTAMLEAYTPRSDPDTAAQVRDSVVDLILRIEFVSWHSDQAMLKIGFAYAIHCVKAYGTWAPDRHLLDGPLKQWTQSREKSANTRSSELAALRRLRVGRRHVAQFSRNIATPPYSASEWRPFRQLSDSRVNADATAIVHLTGHLGLRAHEMSSATGNWIHIDGDRTWLTVPDADGLIRLVPAYGATANWLRSMHHVGADYLIRPKRSWRSSLITDVVTSIASTHPQFAGYKVLRARHMYIVQLLDSAPLTMIHSVAGLKPGSALPVDLLKYLLPPTDDDMYKVIGRTMLQPSPFNPRPLPVTGKSTS